MMIETCTLHFDTSVTVTVSVILTFRVTEKARTLHVVVVVVVLVANS